MEEHILLAAEVWHKGLGMRQLSNEPEQFPVSKLNLAQIGRCAKENQGIVEERKFCIENHSNA
jgi:hypothetical protein